LQTRSVPKVLAQRLSATAVAASSLAARVHSIAAGHDVLLGGCFSSLICGCWFGAGGREEDVEMPKLRGDEALAMAEQREIVPAMDGPQIPG
jgi:hypothetical protein